MERVIVCVGASVLAPLAVLAQSNPTITVNASSGVPIQNHIYGANNIWYWVPGTDFYTMNGGTGSYVSSLQTNADITYMRFPGGWESESYQWSTASPLFNGGPNWTANTVDSGYSNYTATPGATPSQAIGAMGANNVSFVVRTADAIASNNTQAYENWAQVAGGVVAQYCSSVKDWQIGNEWYNLYGAKQGASGYTDYLNRYAKVVFYFSQSMQAAARSAGCSINLFVTSNWASLYSSDGDMANFVSAVESHNATQTAPWTNSGTYVWQNQVTGADVHIYTGVNPSPSKTYPAPSIGSIPAIVKAIKTDGGLQSVYASEWAADLDDNNEYGGLQDANTTMQLLGTMAQSGITQAAYWPPVIPSTAQINSVSLLSNTPYLPPKTPPQNDPYVCQNGAACALPPYTVNADGQAMQLMYEGYQGISLPTSSSGTNTQAIAARNSNNQIVLFLMTNGAPLSENDLVTINGGPSWSKVESAQVMYANTSNGQSNSSGPATIAPVSPSTFSVIAGQSVTVPLSLGGSSSSGTWEIIELILGN